MYQNFQYAVEKWGNNRFIGKRDFAKNLSGPYVWQTYSQVNEQMQKLASGLQGIGLKEKSNIGFYSVNKPEWVIWK